MSKNAEPWYRSLGEKKPPLFPARTTKSARVYFTEEEHALRLTDTRGVRRVAIWCGSLMSLAFVAYVMTTLVLAVAQSSTQSVSVVGVAIITTVLTAIVLGLLSLTLRILRIHRRFTVTVDVPARTCVCRNQLFGWPIKRVAVQANEARWEIMALTGAFEKSDLSGLLFLRLVLLFAGPLGWVALLLVRSRQPITEPREMVGLVLFEGPVTRGVVLMDDETVAEAFLLGWDRHFPPPV